jgi:predicted secreted protein
MSHVLSEDACLYYNAGTYGSPSWSEITNVKDVTLNLDKDEVDVTTRASGGYKEFVDGLIDASISFNMLWDTEDTAFTAIRTAFFAKSAVEFLVLDGNVTAGQGLRATCMVKSFSRNETLGEALTVDVEVRPVRNSDAAPAWYGS